MSKLSHRVWDQLDYFPTRRKNEGDGKRESKREGGGKGKEAWSLVTLMVEGMESSSAEAECRNWK